VHISFEGYKAQVSVHLKYFPKEARRQTIHGRVPNGACLLSANIAFAGSEDKIYLNNVV
jgi:hypothetical protein